MTTHAYLFRFSFLCLIKKSSWVLSSKLPILFGINSSTINTAVIQTKHLNAMYLIFVLNWKTTYTYKLVCSENIFNPVVLTIFFLVVVSSFMQILLSLFFIQILKSLHHTYCQLICRSTNFCMIIFCRKKNYAFLFNLGLIWSMCAQRHTSLKR